MLEDNKQVKEQRRLAKHPPRAVPELVATAPGQVFTWDITKLAGPVRGKYLDCYMMVDIHSRFIVGAHVHATESGALAVEMMKEIFEIHGILQVVHAGRGTSMTSKTVAAVLSDLEVTRSHSRPRVSNDNPYSEALFKTLKYSPEFPERFASVHDAGAFISGFVDWYNCPAPSALRPRLPHARERALRPRRRRRQGTFGNARCSPCETPRTFHQESRSQNPRTPRTSVDQPVNGITEQSAA